MKDRNPLDVETIKELTEENFLLTAELSAVTMALGDAQLRIAYLERQAGPADPNKNIRDFDRQRETALANGKKGIFA